MSYLRAQLDAVQSAMPFGVSGKVQAISGLTIEASDLPLPLGSTCRISSMDRRACLAEVIGFQDDRTLLMPLGSMAGVSRGDVVENLVSAPRVWCSPQLLGRVINGFGEPIDANGPLPMTAFRHIDGGSISALGRGHITEPIATGIRAIDALLTCGLGQRMGIFAGPGIGKSTLVSRIARNTSADVSVIALIGERGREVKQFLNSSLGPDGLARCVVVVCTGDEAPLLRIRAAKIATTIAEYFRDCGKHVLLLMDSLTRMCHGQRQIGLAAKEPPTTRGYPASVFALLPQLLERAGRTPTGSITGFYTVLTEGENVDEDPIADAVKGIIDGQIRLRAALANKGHFPAIDAVHSMSRLREDVADAAQVEQARRVLSLLATYAEIEELVNIGAYVKGANPEFDLAVQARPNIIAFLRQEASAAVTLAESQRQLAELAAYIGQLERKLSGRR